MQDRFKFRIFDKRNKLMRYNDFIVTSNGYVGELFNIDISDENTLFIMRSLDTYRYFSEPMQCTGLKDKNGKMIFEGDICKNIKNGEIVSAAWHGTMAGFVWSKPKYAQINDFGALFRAYDKYEVIGNIYEQPELLEVKE